MNNVGIAGPAGGVEDLDPAAFDHCVQLNVGSPGLTKTWAMKFGERSIRVYDVCPGTDIGEASCWLLSDSARYVAGQVLTVDGNTESLRTG